MRTSILKGRPLAPAIVFAIKKNYIKAWLPKVKQHKVYEVIYPKFKDRLEIFTYRSMLIERAGEKPSPLDKACLELLDHLEKELFEVDLI